MVVTYGKPKKGYLNFTLGNPTYSSPNLATLRHRVIVSVLYPSQFSFHELMQTLWGDDLWFQIKIAANVHI